MVDLDSLPPLRRGPDADLETLLASVRRDPEDVAAFEALFQLINRTQQVPSRLESRLLLEGLEALSARTPDDLWAQTQLTALARDIPELRVVIHSPIPGGEGAAALRLPAEDLDLVLPAPPEGAPPFPLGASVWDVAAEPLHSRAHGGRVDHKLLDGLGGYRIAGGVPLSLGWDAEHRVWRVVVSNDEEGLYAVLRYRISLSLDPLRRIVEFHETVEF